MFQFLPAFVLLVLFFGLTWHEQPANPIDADGRPTGKQPARYQPVKDAERPNPTRRLCGKSYDFCQSAHLPHQECK